MSFGPSFIGFAPEERNKAMKTLAAVIDLKEKNKAAAEESRGFELAEEDKYATRYKPLIEAIDKATEDILEYTSEKDVRVAAKEVVDSITLVKNTQAQLDANPTNEGLKSLLEAYNLQAWFANAKMNFMQASKDYSRTSGNDLAVAASTLQEARDDYAEALSDFQNIQIPIGFVQTVEIKWPPAKGSVFPGSQLEISPTPKVKPAPLPAAVPAPPSLVVSPPAPGLKEKPEPEPTLKKRGRKSAKAKDWISDLLELREGVDKVPPDLRNARVASELVPGSAGISEFPQMDGGPIHIILRDPTGKVEANVSIEKDKKGRIVTLVEVDKEMVMSRTGIENSIPIELLQLPEPSLNKKNIADIIVTNVRIFGGWGKNFWGMDPSKSSGLMKKIMEDPEYSSAVATVSGKLEKKPIGEGTARSGPAKNAPIPKASQMKLGPNGEYGNLIIDVQALYNDGRIIARKRGDEYGSNLHAGKIILDETTSPGLKNLVTKRAMQTTIDKAGAATRAQLVRLRKLAGFNVEKGSGAAKKASPRPSSKSSGIIVVGSPAEIIERMKVACGVFDAGNRSKKNSQLISELASKLMESGVIDKNEYSSILRKYRVGTK